LIFILTFWGILSVLSRFFIRKLNDSLFSGSSLAELPPSPETAHTSSIFIKTSLPLVLRCNKANCCSRFIGTTRSTDTVHV
jgi:hypothetical protein